MLGASGKTRYYLWIAAVSIAVAASVLFALMIYREYSILAENALIDNKRVIVDVETGEVIRGEIDYSDEEEVIQPEEVVEKPDEVEKPRNINSSQLGKGKIALLLMDVGKDSRFDTRLHSSTFPKEVGFVFSPYDTEVQEDIRNTVLEGREAYLHLPLQTPNLSTDDQGELAILNYYAPGRIKQNVKLTLQVAEGYTGVIGSIGEIITRETSVRDPMLQELRLYNVPFIYNERAVNISLKDDARDLELPIIYSYHVLDDILMEEEIDARLNHWTKEFQLEGNNVLLVGRVSALTINRVEKWIEELKKDGIKLSFVSELIRN